jgi:hypothetical protein
MEEKKHHIHFTTEYIRKYLDGQLSGPEMLAMEKAALEDPFLADAIEGYEESRKHPVSFESGVEAIQKKLAMRIRSSNRQTRMVWMFSHWKVAASVLFLLGITLFTVVMVSNNRKTEIADQFKKSKSTEPNIP